MAQPAPSTYSVSGKNPEYGSGQSNESVARRENRIFDSQQEVGNYQARKHDSDVVDNRVQMNTDSRYDIERVRHNGHRHCGHRVSHAARQIGDWTNEATD